MGIFDNMNGVKPRENNNRKLEDGRYRLRIKKCLAKRSKQFNNDVFIVEFEVVESTAPAFVRGDSAVWTQNMQAQGAEETVATFLCAAMGYDTVRDKEEIARDIAPKFAALGYAATDKDALLDVEVVCDVKMKKTKKGFDFRAHSFSPVPEEAAA